MITTGLGGGTIPGSAPRVDTPEPHLRSGAAAFRQERERLFVYSPVIFPFPYSHIARYINRSILLRAIRRWAKITGFARPVIWTFLPTPLARDLMRALDPSLTVYYCIDDLASSSVAARRVASHEVNLLREADLVFVTSEKLRERAALHRSDVHVFPFGVNFSRFAKVRDDDNAVPPDLRALRKPIVGYIGGLHQWVDQPLLAAVATRMPAVTFVLIGPRQTDTGLLERVSNVHLLGVRSHAEVPHCVKGFDVGLVPYRLSDYTSHVYPTKLNEYLALGLPVVATDLAEIRRFNRVHGDIVDVASGPDAFVEAIQHALAPATSAEIERRVAVARANSWEARIATMAGVIDEAIRKRRNGEVAWQVSLIRVYRTARRRFAVSLIALLAAYLLIFQTQFVWSVAEPLRVTAPSRPADAIVVFAGGVGESGQAGGGYQERVKRAVDLYREGLAPRVIFSSGFAYAFREAEIMKELAAANGVPRDAIILEQEAANTYENVVFVKRILEREGWRSALLVSSPYHMKRALLVWQKQAPGIAVHPAPVVENQFYSHQRGASLKQIRGIVHEYAAIAAYWWRGWV